MVGLFGGQKCSVYTEWYDLYEWFGGWMQAFCIAE